MGFIDDHLLLAALESTSSLPPSLLLIDTEEVGVTPVQTTFHLSPQFRYTRSPRLLLEQGVHEPSPEESLAPFYPDPAQRIVILPLILPLRHPIRYLAVSVGALLELKSRGGAEIGWDEWKDHVAIPRHLLDHHIATLWVSGCRLFCICSTESGPDHQMKVYDFSPQGRAQYLSEEADGSLGILRYLSPTPARAQIPWGEFDHACSGHDTIVFSRVSLTAVFVLEI